MADFSGVSCDEAGSRESLESQGPIDSAIFVRDENRLQSARGLCGLSGSPSKTIVEAEVPYGLDVCSASDLPLLILNASPQKDGTCAALTRLLAGRERFDCACVSDVVGSAAEDGSEGYQPQLGDKPSGAYFVQTADLDVKACRGCNACAKTPGHTCVVYDDMAMMLDLLDQADELAVVCPVFFAGPPSHFKALLDRLQPHFWRQTRKQPKRPATLYVVGEGGDPNGFQPLVDICRSALAVAGFKLQSVHPCIGEARDDLSGFLDQVTLESAQMRPQEVQTGSEHFS